MKTNCAFTIVAKNYIGLARILECSIRQYYHEADFYIVVADEMDESSSINVPDHILSAKDVLAIEAAQWENMAFKYNLTEFCTSIKPFALKYFFEKNYEKVVYLDPDILFFSSIEPVYNELNSFSVVLTPHILTIPEIGQTDSPENDWLQCGIFNLGFCAFSKTKTAFDILDWWSKRLINHCFINYNNGEFTDQKWMDFLPAFLSSEELLISRDFGRNVAPWNFFERKISKIDDDFFVTHRNNEDKISKLMFVHYSGYDYNSMLNDSITQKNIEGLRFYDDIKLILDRYTDALKSMAGEIQKYLHLTYSYSTFDNGDKITNIHRKLYIAAIENNLTVSSPFSSDGVLFKSLKKHNLTGGIHDNLQKMKISAAKKEYNSKVKLFNKIFKVIYSLIGDKKFFMMLKMFSYYYKPKNHIYLIENDLK